MKPVAIIGAASLMAFTAFFGLLMVVAVAAGGGAAGGSPSDTATTDIPPELLLVYQAAATNCGMPWTVLAAIGKVETDHGRSPLRGVTSGTNGAGAAGPMQFLSATWAAYGVDGNGDGTIDIYHPVDAIWGAANYLCANGAHQPDRLRSAIWNYNHADWYVNEVLTIAAQYAAAPTSGAVTGDGHYALPLDRSVFDAHPGYLTAPHHHYPASDIPVPVGTTAYAANGGTVTLAVGDDGAKCGGTVIIDGDDGARYMYCHASRILVAAGQHVDAGTPVILTGGRAGSYGAGSSKGPHLHFGISIAGIRVCPQLALVAWDNGQTINPGSLPTAGCTYIP